MVPFLIDMKMLLSNNGFLYVHSIISLFCLPIYSGKTAQYILDTYNNEIIASAVTNRMGSSLPYYECLKILIEKAKEQPCPATHHTDQGSVYSSADFYQTHKDYTKIMHSMSRVGTPTDNPIIESLNCWIKEEMKIDFDLQDAENVPLFIEDYAYYFNNERLSYKLNYQNPVQYRTDQGFG